MGPTVWSLMWGRNPLCGHERGAGSGCGVQISNSGVSFQSHGLHGLKHEAILDVRTCRHCGIWTQFQTILLFIRRYFFWPRIFSKSKPPWAHTAAPKLSENTDDSPSYFQTDSVAYFEHTWAPGLALWHLQSVTGSPGSAPGSWRSLPHCCCQGNRRTCCESGSASECGRWPRSGPGWQLPQVCPAPPLSFLSSHDQSSVTVNHTIVTWTGGKFKMAKINSALQAWSLITGFLFISKDLTVSSGWVSFLLVCTQEHGEGWVRHMEALKWSRKTRSWFR